ncbi:LOW QUALITY PROTEIN: flagellar biosynthesis protein FliP [Bacillus sp. JCM 19047]|nr:LOW QUALITY PROTEIN: flagellar biosynthesis protein FliP [Bacillus sp. JCM 19047]
MDLFILSFLNVDLTNEGTIATTLQIVLLITILSIAPGILILMTCFTRIIIVLSFVRQGLATQTTPPNQVLIGLALFMTFFIMAPVIQDVYESAYIPLTEGELTGEEALDAAIVPIKQFMAQHTREKDLALFMGYGGYEQPETLEDVPITALIPAFAISELKNSFQIGFLIFIPFLVIDMIVASILMSMGMMMLPPVMIALPFKILLFVLVDGWYLVVQSLLISYQ